MSSGKVKVIVTMGFSGPLVGSWGPGEATMPEWVARKMAPSGLVVIQAEPAAKKTAPKAVEVVGEKEETPAVKTTAPKKRRTRTRKPKK